MAREEWYGLKELLFLGMKLEENGAQFYRIAADTTRDQKLKKVLLRLSEEEVRHKMTFEKMYGSYEKVVHEARNVLYDSIVKLQEMVAGHVFVQSQALDLVKKAGAEGDIIRTAIKAEEETVMFFTSLKEVFEERYEVVIDAMIAEEKSHMKTLLEIK